MKYTPYPFQTVATDHAVEFLLSAKATEKCLYSAPTGCGKSVIELLVQAKIGAYIVTPREEIAQGMCDKMGWSDAESNGVFTPIRLRNLFLSGSIPHPKAIIYDESHHHNAESWQQLDLLTGLAPAVGYTATPYRGSPRATKELLERWGEPVQIISLQEAAEMGYVAIPKFTVLPLVDDDIVEIASSGEFQVESLDSATVDRLGDMADHAGRWYNGTWDRVTVFALPSTACCVRLRQEMLQRGLPVVLCVADTPKNERRAAFEALKARFVALIQMQVVSEGVDLPIRRLVDMAPTMSPVKWVQQIGRATRPSDEPPEVVCTNRNILRHAYALEGAVPVSVVVECEEKFPASERTHVRALGLEALGRFKPMPVKTACGAKLHVYSLSTVVDSVVVEYCCLVHPTMEPVWASKVNTVVDGLKKYGSWARCEAPANVKGFSSAPPKELSPKQKAWWSRSASWHGLDVSQEVTRKNFQALPVLSDLGMRVQ